MEARGMTKTRRASGSASWLARRQRQSPARDYRRHCYACLRSDRKKLRGTGEGSVMRKISAPEIGGQRNGIVRHLAGRYAENLCGLPCEQRRVGVMASEVYCAHVGGRHGGLSKYLDKKSMRLCAAKCGEVTCDGVQWPKRGDIW